MINRQELSNMEARIDELAYEWSVWTPRAGGYIVKEKVERVLVDARELHGEVLRLRGIIGACAGIHHEEFRWTEERVNKRQSKPKK